jgi:hypothetical protein
VECTVNQLESRWEGPVLRYSAQYVLVVGKDCDYLAERGGLRFERLLYAEQWNDESKKNYATGSSLIFS